LAASARLWVVQPWKTCEGLNLSMQALCQLVEVMSPWAFWQACPGLVAGLRKGLSKGRAKAVSWFRRAQPDRMGQGVSGVCRPSGYGV